jgi:hypothetical protein
VRLDATVNAAALADQPGSCNGCYTGIDVNDRSAGEIEGTEFEQPAIASPHPVGDRGVHEGDPRNQEYQVGGELEALRNCARNKRRRDDRKHHLENCEQHRWDALVRLAGDIFKPEEVKVPKKKTVKKKKVVKTEEEVLDA